MRMSEDATERKQTPIYSGFIAYFPLAIAAVARHSYLSNEQHNPGEPLHWAREKSADETDALARHLVDMAMAPAGDLDEQIVDATAIAWRAMANLQKLKEKQLAAAPASYLDEGIQQLVRDETDMERYSRMPIHEVMRELRLKDEG